MSRYTGPRLKVLRALGVDLPVLAVVLVLRRAGLDAEATGDDGDAGTPDPTRPAWLEKNEQSQIRIRPAADGKTEAALQLRPD